MQQSQKNSDPPQDEPYEQPTPSRSRTIPLPFKEVMADVLKVKPPEKQGNKTRSAKRK